jgi:hypothetical protein
MLQAAIINAPVLVTYGDIAECPHNNEHELYKGESHFCHFIEPEQMDESYGQQARRE